MSCCQRSCSFWCEFSSLCTVEFIKFTFYRAGFFCQLVHCATCVFCFSTQEFNITLLCRFHHNLFSLLQSQCMFQSVTAGSTHIIHADCCNGFETRIYFCRTDSETSTAANTDYTDKIPVDKRTCTEKIYRSAKVFRINFRQNGIARLAFAPTPKRKVYGKCDKSSFRHFRCVKVRTLFLDCSHRVSDNDCRVFVPFFHVLGQKQISGYLHFILVGKRNFLHTYQITFIKVICICLCRRKISSEHHNKYSC